MRLADARRFALSLPETTEEPHFEAGSFRVRGKIFATVPPGGKSLRIFVERDEVEALIAEDATTYEPVIWGKRVVEGAVCVNLRTARLPRTRVSRVDRRDGRTVRVLVHGAWVPRRAPRALCSGSQRRCPRGYGDGPVAPGSSRALSPLAPGV